MKPFEIIISEHYRVVGTQESNHCWKVCCTALGTEFKVYAFDANEAKHFSRLRVLALCNLRIEQLCC